MSKWDFNSLRPSASPPRPRHFYIPPDVARATPTAGVMCAGSASSEDPLFSPGPSKPKFAVVLGSSQRQDAEAGESVVMSDLSRFGRVKQSPLMKEKEKVVKSSGRPRGRPKGSGLGSHKIIGSTAAGAREARQVKVRPSMNGFGKRRGRPPKAPSPPPRAIYESLRPQFIEFVCEWKDCNASLQNLSTLRRHIHIVHGDATHCAWGTCRDSSQFDTDEAFEAHVEEKHIVPFAWHVGDGHHNAEPVSVKEETVPDYLKDGEGRQVTPWVKDQEVEDLQTWRANRKKLKELMRRRDEKLEDDSEEMGKEEEDMS